MERIGEPGTLDPSRKSTSSYGLRRGLRFCICSGRAVFLDIPGDRYFCLPPSSDADFQRWAAGEANDDPDALQKLVELGILVASGAELPVAQPAFVPAPVSDLSREVSSNIAWTLLAVIEQCIARIRLRRSTFGRLVQGLEDNAQTPVAVATNGRSHAKVAGAFARSSLLVHSRDNCLSQSLAFRRACRRLGLDGTLVIGVRLDPFAAHCWFQHEDVVLNDSVERVRHYTPILVA